VVMTGSAGQTTESSVPSPGQRRRTGRGHVDSFGEGRVCAAPGCTTELSRYNESSACWLHADSVMGSVARWAR
jgi:hypothetical protein